MVDNIKEMLASKKFKVALFSILGLVCSVMADKMPVSQAIEAGITIAMVYLGAQGLADFGKSKAEVDAKTAKETGDTAVN